MAPQVLKPAFLRRGHAILLYIIPILLYVMPKQALKPAFLKRDSGPSHQQFWKLTCSPDVFLLIRKYS